jgi:hypothetical protein
MGIVDAFSKDDRVELRVNELIGYFRGEAQTYAENKVMINGLRAGLSPDDILVMIGKKGTDCVLVTDEK